MSDLLTVDLWLAEEPKLLPVALQESWAKLLSLDEQARWQRFARAEDQQRFLLTRALARTVLAKYLDVEPAALQFVQNEHGKPMLAATAAPKLHFNLSHTRGLVVLAVCRNAELGVDVENVTRKAEILDLARRYFSPLEIQRLESVDGLAQRDQFFALWTLKEAWVKAKGLGLRLPLHDFGFQLQDAGLKSNQITLHCEKSLQEEPEHWWFQRNELKQFRVALAVSNPAAASVLVKVLRTDAFFKPRVSNC